MCNIVSYFDALPWIFCYLRKLQLLNSNHLPTIQIFNVFIFLSKNENTIKIYANSMSKFLAIIEFLPELVSMKGFNYTGVKAEIQKIQQSHVFSFQRN